MDSESRDQLSSFEGKPQQQKSSFADEDYHRLNGGLTVDGDNGLAAIDGRQPKSSRKACLIHNSHSVAKSHASVAGVVCNGGPAMDEDMDEQRMDVPDVDNNRCLTNGDINDNNDMADNGNQWANEWPEEGLKIEPFVPEEPIGGDGEEDVSDTLKKDFTETIEKLTIYMYVKNVSEVFVDFTPKSIAMKYKVSDSKKTFVWNKDLYKDIIPEESHHRLGATKIEVCLKKKEETHFMWGTIEDQAQFMPEIIANGVHECQITSLGPHLPANRMDADITYEEEEEEEEDGDDNRKAYYEKKAQEFIHALKPKRHFGAVHPSTSSEGKELVLVVDNNDNSVSKPLRPMRPKLVGRTGLHNLGNTCFMNAVIQCLSNTDPFRSYFTSDEFRDDINETNCFGSGGVIAHTYADLMKQLWSGTDTAVAPNKLKERMGEKWATFSSYLQQDAQEFCAFLLDALHEDLNRCRERRAISDDKSDESNECVEDQRLADEAWKRFKLLNDSIVTQLFHGQYKSRLICPVCHKISVTFDPFVYLSLPLPKPKLEYDVYFFKRDTNGMSTTSPSKLVIKLVSESMVSNLLEEVWRATGVETSYLRCVSSLQNGKIEKFLQPKWTLERPDIKKYLLVFELMAPKPELKEESVEFVVVQRLCQPIKSDNCAKCDKNEGWDNVDLKQCKRCHRVSYCDKTCQSEHWSEHKPFCVYKPEPIAIPFIITVAKSQLTYRNLCAVIYSYARHSVKTTVLPQAINLNEFPIPPPFSLKIYKDSKEDEEVIGPNVAESDRPFDTLLDINTYYIALDWINSKSFGDIWTYIEPRIGLMSETDYNYLKYSNKLNEVIDLEECLRLHTKTEVLTADNPWYCPKCKDTCEATKQITLWRLPNILVVQLKRFSFKSNLWREKLDPMVHFPIHGLDMSAYYVRTDNNPDFHPLYDLYGVINHYGGLFGGHYTAFAKASHDYKNLGWRCFDDYRVDEMVDEEDVVTRNAYMLFYKLRENN